MKLSLTASLAFAVALPIFAADPVAPLPPLPPWSGKTRSLIVAANDPWITPSERTRLTTTPNYDDTVAWLRKLVAAAPQLKMVSLGRSAEGRDIWMVIASKEKAFTPDTLRKSGKPTVFAQAGIHAGEIDGKDAGLMLLRDMTVRGTKRDLLDHANLLFVPIFNVDGHEHASRYTRINQRGPEISGWRTNARNLNLNRDYMKVDAEETQAIVRAIDAWHPDLYLDLHVTDGLDYQYDVTFGWNGAHTWSPSNAAWLDATFRPEVESRLKAEGHVPGKLVFTVAGDDPEKGLIEYVSDPRFSTGYVDARHIPSILVENHSLKPYDQRVLGTYVFLDQTLRTVGAHAQDLRAAIHADETRNAATIPFTFKVPDTPPERVEFLGVERRTTLSPVSGALRSDWLGRPVTMRVPYLRSTDVVLKASRPKAYWIPAAWTEAIAKLTLHGVRFERIPAPREVDVEMLRMSDVKYATDQFEGRVRTTAKSSAEKRHERFSAGSIRIPTDQPLGTIAVLLLEPDSPDSFFQWGLFNSALTRTEYAESYMLEPLAEQMLAASPELAKEFREKIATDDAFRNDSEKRLDWFYRKSPWYDERAMLYPVARELP
jgi:hypothetical protein